MVLTEIGLWLAVVIIGIAIPRRFDTWINSAAHILTGVAARQKTCVVAIGVIAVLARLAVLPVLPLPAPAVHDEFSYLLMADTFAHGRLTNPTPALWEHFETFHEDMVPTYCSMFYPAQGAFLAFGQVVFGNPFWGVVLSTALMCAAICWMLQAWVSPGWALLGGLLAVARLAMFSYWNDSYWGGSVAALGGALVLGALPRIKNRPRAQTSMLFALGVGLIFNTRPYESIFLMIPVAVALTYWLVQKRRRKQQSAAKQFIAPALTCFTVVIAFMGFYFWRTTGNPFRPPYFEHVGQYSISPYFPWLKPRSAPIYRHPEIESYYKGWHLQQWLELKNNPIGTEASRLLISLSFYVGSDLGLLICVSVFMALLDSNFRSPTREMWICISIVGVSFLGSALPANFLPHYLAPAMSAMYVIIAKAFAFTALKYKRSARTERAIAAATILVVLGLVPLRITARLLHTRPDYSGVFTWDARPFDFSERAQLLASLQSTHDNKLVIVHYSPEHDTHREWVFNSADITQQRVIWARDMGPEKNRELIDYFKDRKVWLVEPDLSPVRITPYPYEAAANSSSAPN